MRSSPEDRKTSAVIRDAAMDLFASQGTAVTVRQIAAAAGVSPGLVIHHFGSKNGLKEAMDRHAARFVEDMLAELTQMGGERGGISLAEMFARRLEEEEALAGYVRRLLYEGGDAGDALFARLFEATRTGMGALAEVGVVRRARDEDLRSAVLLANDLAMILLRDQIRTVTGVDPLEQLGLLRWSAELIDIYTNGIFASGTPTPQAVPEAKRSRTRR